MASNDTSIESPKHYFAYSPEAGLSGSTLLGETRCAAVGQLMVRALDEHTTAILATAEDRGEPMAAVPAYAAVHDVETGRVMDFRCEDLDFATVAIEELNDRMPVGSKPQRGEVDPLHLIRDLRKLATKVRKQTAKTDQQSPSAEE